MDELGLDALVAFSPDNVAYGAGYLVPSQVLGMRDRHFAVVATRNGDSAMLLTANERDEAESRGGIASLYPYDQFAEDPMRVLATVLADLGLTDATVGVELDAL